MTFGKYTIKYNNTESLASNINTFNLQNIQNINYKIHINLAYILL